MDVTVACVLRSGGDFTPEYVERLRDGVAEHLPGARFVCLSDVTVPCERIPLETKWRGWWAKLELFRLTEGRILYFDLDTVIRGSLEEIAAYPHRFSIGMNWRRPGAFNSTFMAWDGDFSHIFRAFHPRLINDYSRSPARWGDQGFIQDHLGSAAEDAFALFPGQFVSWKKHCRQGVPPEARVVCFHGKPRPHEIGWRLDRAA